MGRMRVLGGVASLAVLLTAGVYFLGFAWSPGGNAPQQVLHGPGCTVLDGSVSVDAPQSADQLLTLDDDPAWSLLAYDAGVVLRTGGGYGAERYVKAQLPWTVRMRLSWDSESDLLAAYGREDDICMLARVVEQRRLALSTART